jgi:type VI protein secretion system component VasF
MKQQVKNNQLLRIVLEIVGGFIVAVVLCAVLIFIGYYHTHSAGLTAYTVRFFQIPIYEIATTEGQMRIHCCVVLCAVLIFIAHTLRRNSSVLSEIA